MADIVDVIKSIMVLLGWCE